MRRLLCLLALLLICLPTDTVKGEETESRFVKVPEILLFTQHTVENLDKKLKLGDRRTYPDTASKAVNEQVSALVDELAEKTKAHMPARGRSGTAWLDTGATVYVTGTRTASFLVLSHVLNNKEQTAVELGSLVFDLKTGQALTPDDILMEDANDYVREQVISQVTDYFPGSEPDQQALSQAADGWRQACFSLSPAYLLLHFRADSFYEKRTTTVHVRIPYKALEPFMTDYARRETDNSRYLLACPTFDDGPGRGVTQSILILLREQSGRGTFFNCGAPMRKAHDYVAWEHDAGHAVQSHTYSHTFKLTDKKKMFKERDRFAKEQAEIIGKAPEYMRAPGGSDKLYCDYEIGMPIIRWTTLSTDASEKVNINNAHATFVHTLHPSSVILMHNVRWSSLDVARVILASLRERGYMTVTVDELFSIRDIELENNKVYFGYEADGE